MDTKKIERISAKIGTKYPYVSSMYKDLDEMVNTLRGWARASSSNGISYAQYYGNLADLIEKAREQAKKVSRALE